MRRRLKNWELGPPPGFDNIGTPTFACLANGAVVPGRQLTTIVRMGLDDMSNAWEQQYLAAIFEADPAKRRIIAEQAEKSIKLRMRELMSDDAPTTAGEMTKLSDALRVVRDFLGH